MFSNKDSTCGSIMAAALARWPRYAKEGSISAFSQPSGSPASTQGKRSSTRLIRSPNSSMARPSVGRNRAALIGVVTIVTMTPRLAKSFAMSTMGIIWPCAMNGKRTK
ncbi:hypothetical protein LINGRAHAP2_LOCUS12625 [Linum grandiflorum]